MAFLFRTWAIVHIVIKRLFAQFGMALVTVIGLVAAISLVVSIPIYADAVYRQTFCRRHGRDSGVRPASDVRRALRGADSSGHGRGPPRAAGEPDCREIDPSLRSG